MFCGVECESINKILFLCPFARQVWALSIIPYPSLGFGNSEFQNLHYLFSLKKYGDPANEYTFAYAWILRHLWKNRNSMLFDGLHLI